ncbi:MAG TPA: hypothetical protein VMK42_09855 [Anaeromyxobacteraceae bacterium]|nr:hypothetical protein [Anaeromyxobacteraceae bacterium]
MLLWAAAILSVVEAGGGLSSEALLAPAPPQVALVLAEPRSDADGRGSSACYLDVCQPAVALPGQEARFDVRGRRTELALSMLASLNAEPFSGVARSIALAGVRLDYLPPQMDSGPHTGFGKVNLSVRWRLDAFGEPDWLAWLGLGR